MSDFDRIHFMVNGVKVEVDAIGTGHPVLYLHGGATIEGFSFARHLASRFQVFCPYHPGMGASSDAPETYSIEGMVQHYLSLIESLKLDRKPHVIGFSMGGWIASELAAKNSNVLDKLVLVAPDGLNDPNFPSANLDEAEIAELPGYFAHTPSLVQEFFPDEGDDQAIELFVAERQREELMVSSLYQSLSDSSEFKKRLGRIENKTLIVWGQEDRILPAQQMGIWAENVKSSVVQEIENAGHFVMQEQPGALKKIAEFLA